MKICLNRSGSRIASTFVSILTLAGLTLLCADTAQAQISRNRTPTSNSTPGGNHIPDPDCKEKLDCIRTYASKRQARNECRHGRWEDQQEAIIDGIKFACYRRQLILSKN